MMKIGIVCGLESEAKLARLVTGALVAKSAARPDQARAAARDLIAQGATHLLSFGLAGGLDPDLAAGACVVGTSVCADGAVWACDEAWSQDLCQKLPFARSGLVLGVEKIMVQSVDKARAYQATKAMIADMESQCVAAVAHEMGIPFAVVRAVTDTASLSLPPAACVPLRSDGGVDLFGVLASLCRAPRQLLSLIKVGLNTGKAMSVLKKAAQGILSVA